MKNEGVLMFYFWNLSVSIITLLNPWCIGGQICNHCKWQEAPTVDHIYKQYKKRHLEAKFTTNASSTTWWPKLELIHHILNDSKVLVSWRLIRVSGFFFWKLVEMDLWKFWVLLQQRRGCKGRCSCCPIVRGRFPRVFGDKFGEEFCDKFGGEFSGSPNLVMN